MDEDVELSLVDGKRPPRDGAPDGGATQANADSEEAMDLTGDYGNLALLLLLYTLQGVPMGLANSVTFVLQERGASYAAQGATRALIPRTWRQLRAAALAQRVLHSSRYAHATSATAHRRHAAEYSLQVKQP